MSRLFTALLSVFLLLTSWVLPGWSAPVPKEVIKGREAEVHMVGVYHGSKPPTGGNVGTVVVDLSKNRRPIFLVVSAYDRVHWQINDPNKTVVKVLATGYHEQTVAGLTKSVPVQESHYGKSNDYFYAYKLSSNSTKMLSILEKWSGKKEIVSRQGVYSTDKFEISSK